MTSRRIDRASFRGAYKAIFANASKVGILSVAHEYATPAAATASLHDPAGVRSLISQMRGHRTAPTGAPRSNAVSVAGTLTEESKRVPAYTVVWQHGRTLNLVLLFGIGTTGQPVRPGRARPTPNMQSFRLLAALSVRRQKRFDATARSIGLDDCVGLR